MAVNFYLRLARSQHAVKAEIPFILFHLMQRLRTLSRDADPHQEFDQSTRCRAYALHKLSMI